MAIDRSRRRFIGTVAAGGAAMVTSSRARAARPRALSSDTARPAVLGGPPVRTAPFPGWPVADAREEQALTNVVRSGKWWRGSGEQVARFESAYAALTGAKHCLATANGTSSLLVALSALDIGPGDEVVVPPYTFVATINAVLALHALPVFVDTDVETFQIDARKVAAAITERTRAILPVHLGGSPADLDTILAAASSKRVPVIEDACQAHLAEWRHRKVGTYGHAGCFSFQASKNLNSGEGGALLTNDDEFIETCYAFHNNSRGRRNTGSDSFSYRASGLNLRLTEMQAALLIAQMTRLEEQSRQRDTNAAHLTARLRDIPGILPARTYEGCTRNAYHLYMFRYDATAFAGLSRGAFLKALRAEGVPASGGYSPLDKEPFLARTLSGRGYQKIYGSAAMDAWRERTRCPQNDRLCNEAVWFGQTMLLGSQSDTDQIADAVAKVQRHARDIASLSSEL
jgi:dTDP-4-amino-4,6-dideoxygalactose transaminase